MNLTPPSKDADASGGLQRGHFDALYGASDDPWHLRSSWYEERKRALLLASLPAATFSSAYEPACAAGELTAQLALRCERLLASDGNERAVQLTRERMAPNPNVRVMQAWLPGEWPAGPFDLIVLSEFLYYLSPDAVDALALRVLQSKTAGAVVVACHWRDPIEGCALDGPAVHQRLSLSLDMPRIAHYVDDDFCLDVWQSGEGSPAQKEQRR